MFKLRSDRSVCLRVSLTVLLLMALLLTARQALSAGRRGTQAAPAANPTDCQAARLATATNTRVLDSACRHMQQCRPLPPTV